MIHLYTEKEWKITRDQLVEAKKLIENKRHWIKEEAVKSLGNGEYAFCAVGAVFTVEQMRTTHRNNCIFGALRVNIPGNIGSVSFYNDARETTHQDILNLFDDAISTCDQAIEECNG
jgi:hypothetical protein